MIKPRQSKVGTTVPYSTAACVFTALLLPAMWLASAALLHWQWQQTVGHEIRKNASTAMALREYTQHIFDSVDNAMWRVQDTSTDDICKEIVRIAHETGMAPYILTQLSFVGTDGRLRCSNLDHDGSYSKHVALMDRAHVRIHLQPGDADTPLAGVLQDGLFISQALEGRVSGAWTLQMSRKINHRDGSTRGVLVASINQSHLGDVYNSAQQGPEGYIMLVGLDGVARARSIDGGISEADMLLPDSFTQLLGVQPDGATTSASFDDLPRVTAYSRLGSYPLTVVSSTTQANALATWHSTRNASIVLVAALSLGVVGVMALFLGSMRRLASSLTALARSEAQAQGASEAKSEFLATMCHELRTPLTSIRGFAELMELRSQEPLIREQARLICLGAEHLNTLLNEILDLSKIESGAMPTHTEPVLLPDLVREVTELFSVSAQAKSLQLQTLLHPEASKPLVTDRLKLKQILNNLLSNAIKFTDQGHVELAVEPSADGRQMLFHATDTGPGIDSAMHESIFEKFSQGDARVSCRHGGTGLGLSLSRSLATLLGGTLTLQSHPGDGARFTLALPLVQKAAT